MGCQLARQSRKLFLQLGLSFHETNHYVCTRRQPIFKAHRFRQAAQVTKKAGRMIVQVDTMPGFDADLAN